MEYKVAFNLRARGVGYLVAAALFGLLFEGFFHLMDNGSWMLAAVFWSMRAILWLIVLAFVVFAARDIYRGGDCWLTISAGELRWVYPEWGGESFGAFNLKEIERILIVCEPSVSDESAGFSFYITSKGEAKRVPYDLLGVWYKFIACILESNPRCEIEVREHPTHGMIGFAYNKLQRMCNLYGATLRRVSYGGELTGRGFRRIT